MSQMLASLRMAARPAIRLARKEVLPRLLPTARRAPPSAHRHVRVVGLLSSASGLGKSARLCAEAIMAAGIPVETVDVAGLWGTDDGIAYPRGKAARAGPGLITIYHLNPPMLVPGMLRAGLRRHYGGYTIGYWAWELEVLPAEWQRAIRLVDAVMVPSTFCQAVIQRYTPKPVLLVPHPVPYRPPPAAADTRAGANTRDGDRFRVVSVFNFGSSFARKNPLALVQAFRAAFPGRDDVELVLKTSQGHKHAGDKARLQAAVAGTSNIRLIDELWSEAELETFLHQADAFASLHRSEGFGLGPAEAIQAGLPVMVTDWSATTDFCRKDLCYPVDYRLVPFADDHPDYAGVRGAQWAEPDLASAVAQLQRMESARGVARAKAQGLNRHLQEFLARYSYAAALEDLRGAAPDPGRKAAAPDLTLDDQPSA